MNVLEEKNEHYQRIFYGEVYNGLSYIIITKIIKNNKLYYSIDNCDCTVEKYKTIEEVYQELFNCLKYTVDKYFYEENDDVITSNFYGRCFIIETVYINSQLLTIAKQNNYKFVQSSLIKADDTYDIDDEPETETIMVLTNKLYYKYKDIFKLQKLKL